MEKAKEETTILVSEVLTSESKIKNYERSTEREKRCPYGRALFRPSPGPLSGMVSQ